MNPETIEIMEASLRESTRTKYKSSWKRFLTYCSNESIDIHNISIREILNYFGYLFRTGASFSVINTSKISLSHFLHFPPYQKLSDHPIIDKFFNGLFNLNPPKPKLSTTWEVNIVFSQFIKWGDNALLTDKKLTQKLLLLLLLLGGQRVNTIFSFTVNSMLVTDISVTFAPSNVLKHSKKGSKLGNFSYNSYPHEPLLCVVSCCSEYLQRRSKRVDEKEEKLFITYGKPYKAASIDSLRRWAKDLFSECNILHSPHSCRSASTSKAALVGIDLDSIFKKACWKNQKTFLNHYKKNITVAEEPPDFNKIITKN